MQIVVHVDQLLLKSISFRSVLSSCLWQQPWYQRSNERNDHGNYLSSYLDNYCRESSLDRSMIEFISEDQIKFFEQMLECWKYHQISIVHNLAWPGQTAVDRFFKERRLLCEVYPYNSFIKNLPNKIDIYIDTDIKRLLSMTNRVERLYLIDYPNNTNQPAPSSIFRVENWLMLRLTLSGQLVCV